MNHNAYITFAYITSSICFSNLFTSEVNPFYEINDYIIDVILPTLTDLLFIITIYVNGMLPTRYCIALSYFKEKRYIYIYYYCCCDNTHTVMCSLRSKLSLRRYIFS